MAADNQSIKDAMALSGNKPAVTNDHLARLQTAVDVSTGIVGSTPDDFWDATYDLWKDLILDREHSLAQDQIVRATEL